MNTLLNQLPELDRGYAQMLIRRINNASDFKYDDEAVLLNEVLKSYDLKWKWSGQMFHEYVEVYKEEN